MGEVYQAEDLILQRIVALKFLPRDISGDPGKLRRFQREAKAASGLNHPNITHVYEILHEGDVNFIAMEYVEGETLEAKLARGGGMSVADVLHTGIAIGRALEAAHAHGVVHRDIKPSNIMIGPASQIKVLDFGLAKTFATEGEGSQAPTETQTETGIILGTVHYMSPEQALGATVDHRCDIFSLGIVMYEMISGKRPFSGANAQVVLRQILSADPEPVQLSKEGIMAELEFVIRKCLRKKPSERYQAVSDLIADLAVLERRASGEQEGRITLGEYEFVLPRRLARTLFVVLQVLYLVFYVSSLRWADGMNAGLVHMLGTDLGSWIAILYLITAPIGIAVRLFLITTVAWDHIETGVRYRLAFPAYFLLDVLWSVSPFGLSLRMGELLSLACVPPLVFSPFAQRTLIRSAYDLRYPRRAQSSG